MQRTVDQQFLIVWPIGHTTPCLGSHNRTKMHARCHGPTDTNITSQPKCLCSPFALLLAAVPRLLPADAALVAAPCLRDLWSLQICFSLYADNCHPSSTIRGSTQCDELHPPRHIDPPSISMLN
ncbi:hypothetical protein VNO80_08266 [Phaseolus coccineus]|uniref:Uncharacterized protein n=1 Tax=Phaseolus coccineus TaxID=3886 RepID=A0AAN9RKD5_PHACN